MASLARYVSVKTDGSDTANLLLKTKLALAGPVQHRWQLYDLELFNLHVFNILIFFLLPVFIVVLTPTWEKVKIPCVQLLPLGKLVPA